MNNEQLLAEIREANLTYLMLAQTMIRQDKAEAVFRLGLNEESCELLGSLSSAQVLKLASRNTLLASFRARHPGIRPRFTESGGLALEAAVSRGEVDLAISVLPVVSTSSIRTWISWRFLASMA